MDETFLRGYSTQKEASFPSHVYDGPFSGLAIQILRQQRAELEILLGKDYFEQHPSSAVRNAKGLILLKEMSASEFIAGAEDLRKKVELDQ